MQLFQNGTNPHSSECKPSRGIKEDIKKIITDLHSNGTKMPGAILYCLKHNSQVNASDIPSCTKLATFLKKLRETNEIAAAQVPQIKVEIEEEPDSSSEEANEIATAQVPQIKVEVKEEPDSGSEEANEIAAAQVQQIKVEIKEEFDSGTEKENEIAAAQVPQIKKEVKEEPDSGFESHSK